MSTPVNRIHTKKAPEAGATLVDNNTSPLRVKSFALETPPKPAAAASTQNKFATAAPIAFRKAPKAKVGAGAGTKPVTTIAGAFSQLKHLKGQ